MDLTGTSLDIFFHKMPMGTALFDRNLTLSRCNPTWASYVEGISQISIEPDTYFYDLLPGTENTIQPFIDRALSGEMASIDGLRLSSNNTVFFWDASFVPWVQEGVVSGFLQVVTDVTERILSRQLLERRVVDRTRKLSAIYDVMAVAAEPLDLKEILDQSLQRVLAAIHAQAGAIQLLDPSGEVLLLATQQGLAPGLAKKLRVTPANSGLSGWTTEQEQPLVLTDVTTDRRTSNLIRRSGYRAYVGVPMMARGKVIGILSTFRETKRPFSREDISLLDSVSDQIGTAVENARLRLANEHLLIMEERNRLARELHDAVTQSLYSLTLYAETGKRFAQMGDLEKANEYIDEVEETAQQALREMRLLLHNLRPSILEQVGLVQAIKQRLDAVEKRVHIKVDFKVQGELDLPPFVEEALYQIAQEALNNALKHAVATEVSILLQQESTTVRLLVTDNGQGFAQDALNDSGGLGLISMRERVDSLNGTLNVVSELSKGSQIEVNLDLDKVGELAEALELLDLLH